MTTTPYENAVAEAQRLIAAHGGWSRINYTVDSSGAILAAAKMVASALLAVAESNRPQPPQVHVTVTDIVAEKVQEATRKGQEAAR